MSDVDNKYIEGAGGKGGKRAPREAPNTLRSRSTIKVVEVLSEGEIKGLVGGLKGVFFDNTPVQNQDGTFNFPAINYEERTGTLAQDYMGGFPGAEAAVVVNVQLTSPVVRSVSSATVDAVRIAVRLPQGLSNLDQKSGDLNGHRVGVAIDVRPKDGTWSNAFTKTITGKTTTTYEESYRVEKPNTATGLWEVRVRRTTPESESSTISDRLDWFTMTEIQDIKISYPEAAFVGIAIDSESTGGAVPKRSYLIDGLIVKVPTNYTPTVYNPNGSVASYASYSGIWNGTFKDSWCDDPAWILYDMLTHERYGMGDYINVADIDIYSFYEASKYNTQLILVGDGSANMEPRFRCNAPIASREDAFKVLQSIAAMSRCMLFSGPGYIRLVQDRPQAPSALLTNANVIDGQFSYVGTPLSSRITSVDVTYNDIRDNYLPATTTLDAGAAALSAYGFNKAEITALGVVHEGQAIRLAKWMLDSTLNDSEMVTFSVSWNNAFIEINDIVNIADNFYAAAQFSGIIKDGGTVNRIILDRPITVTTGQTIKFQAFDGVEHTRTINGSGTLTALNLVPLTGAVKPGDYAGCAWMVLGTVAPRQFKVTHIKEDSPGIYEIMAASHDPTKYARVEEGIYITPPAFTNVTGWTIGAPQNVTVTPETYITSQGAVSYRLRMNWNDVDDSLLRAYRVQYRRNNGQFTWTPDILQSEYIIEDALQGIYEFFVYAYNTRGVQSPGTSGFYDLHVTGTAPSPLNAPTSLVLATGGTVFNGTNFTVKWNAPVATTAATFKNYVISFYTAADVEVKTIEQTGLSLEVTRQDIISWYGSATRSIKVRVRAKDTLDRVGIPVTTTFTNPAPAVPTGVTLTAFSNYYQIAHNAIVGVDAVGVRIHHSKVAGLTPSAANLAKDDVGITHIVEADATATYYVKLAAYDSWGTDELIYSGEYNITTTSSEVGILPTPPTGLAVTSSIIETAPGVQQAKINITWTKSSNTDMYDLDIQAASIGYAEFPVVSQPASGTTGSYSFIGTASVAYAVKIRSRAATNVSVWSAAVNHTASGDTVAPGTPTGFTVAAGLTGAVLNWTNPTATDLAGIEVYRRKTTAPTVGEALVTTLAVVANSIGGSGFFYDTNLIAGQTYQYRIRAVDKSGNTSGYTTLTSVVPINVDSEVADGSITVAKFAAGLKPIEVLGSLPASGNTTGRMVFLTTDSKLYRYNGSAWVKEIPFSDVSGQIVATQITNNSITSAQINANSVRAAVLTADSISAGMIVAGSIRATELATDSVTTDKLHASAITAAKITAGIINTNHMTANTINGDRIQANTLHANRITANTITATQIFAGSITANELNVANVRAGILTANAITSGMITAGHITATHVATNEIVTNSANIKNGTITNAKISGAIQSDDFANNSKGWQIDKAGGIQLNGSGAAGRTQITPTEYKVYDPSGTLRVRMGIW